MMRTRKHVVTVCLDECEQIRICTDYGEIWIRVEDLDEICMKLWRAGEQIDGKSLGTIYRLWEEWLDAT